ncbi:MULTISPECIES: hypothetical protein [Pseudomonas]|uniref:hypothetical protein n=1 Tax=Pseudomonas TaxID=286 RepID=UPI000FC424E1|nr:MULTISPECIES: hypothetical protein [Pseudomonas]RUE17039.1 hypothetical protein IPC1222_25345 [Pseudomonas aeruginosa]CAH0135870.1 hypothetical protein SRABI111_00336 [Pseudomonas carnis]CAH0138870.1 hypothetical protein SRABI110_00480 [Pseudomonas carnis]CAH0158245.1 hypothetical protein SRABI64_00712 [Pseudomonas carnis]CAH0201938.1 hypothetical protein SRABI08_01914 [Pseudomonas carnis]
MNAIKEYTVTGLAILATGLLIAFLGKFLVAFDFMSAKHAGLYVVGAILAVCVLIFAFKFLTDIEHFNVTMMIASMAIGGGVFISMFGMGGVFYALFFGAFCKTLEHVGFYKAMYRRLGNILGSGVAMVYKPKVNKFSKYL